MNHLMLLTLTVPNPASSSMVTEAIKPMLSEHSVFCFHGDLGAGKTTFIKQVCRVLGVDSETSSPSFSIVNEYQTSQNEVIYHFDLYRLKDQWELMDIGWEDYLNSGRTMLIEWPEMAEALMPDDAVHLFIEQNPDESRTITIKRPKL